MYSVLCSNELHCTVEHNTSSILYVSPLGTETSTSDGCGWGQQEQELGNLIGPFSLSPTPLHTFRLPVLF